MYAIKEDWLRSYDEPVLEPDLPVIDPHHHLWDRDNRYLLDELLDDTNSGHNVRATVFIQCRSMYRADGPEALQPVGETEFVNGVAAMSASGSYGSTRICAGIVEPRGLAARSARAGSLGGSPRGEQPFLRNPFLDRRRRRRPTPTPTRPPKGIMGDPGWREGFAQLQPLGLTFDALLFHTQIPS